MLRPGSLKARLSLMITALLALVTAAGGAYLVQKARDDTREEALSTLALTGHFLDAQIDVLEDRWATQGLSAPHFKLRDLGDIRHLSVQFYDARGRLTESNEQPSGPKPRAPRWFADWVKHAAPVSAPEIRPVTFDGALVGNLVLAPDPSYETEEMWTTSRGLLGLLLVFFVLVNAMVWWAASRAMRPVARILDALGHLQRGDLSARLPLFGLPELSRISVGFNHMAETLELSVSDNQRLTRQLLSTQETERSYLARELHDEIGQCVSAIHADAAAIRNRGGENVRESAEAIVAVTSHIKQIVRSMLQRLRPPIVAGLGLSPALRDLIAAFEQHNPGVSCAFYSSTELNGLEGEVSVALYRVIQESLTNIAVHANAQRVSIEVLLSEDTSLRPEARRACVTVEDDGVGFFLRSANEGFGLTGIRERVKGLGGTCEIDTHPGRGTRVAVQIPL